MFFKTKCVSQLYAVHQAVWSHRKQAHQMGVLTVTDTYTHSCLLGGTSVYIIQ